MSDFDFENVSDEEVSEENEETENIGDTEGQEDEGPAKFELPEGMSPAEFIRQQGWRFSTKEDGTDKEVEFDKLIGGYQRGSVSQKRFDDANSKYSAFEKLQNNVKNNPAALLKAAGIDPDEWAEEHTRNFITEHQMTDEEREARAKDDRLKEYERQDKEREDQADDANVALIQRQVAKEITEQMPLVLEKYNIPPTKAMARQILGKMRRERNENNYPISIDEAAHWVSEEVYKVNKNHLSEMSAEDVYAYLGEDGMKKLRKHDLSRLNKSKRVKKVEQVVGKGSAKKPEPKKRITLDELDDMF